MPGSRQASSDLQEPGAPTHMQEIQTNNMANQNYMMMPSMMNHCHQMSISLSGSSDSNNLNTYMGGNFNNNTVCGNSNHNDQMHQGQTVKNVAAFSMMNQNLSSTSDSMNFNQIQNSFQSLNLQSMNRLNLSTTKTNINIPLQSDHHLSLNDNDLNDDDDFSPMSNTFSIFNSESASNDYESEDEEPVQNPSKSLIVPSRQCSCCSGTGELGESENLNLDQRMQIQSKNGSLNAGVPPSPVFNIPPPLELKRQSAVVRPCFNRRVNSLGPKTKSLGNPGHMNKTKSIPGLHNSNYTNSTHSGHQNPSHNTTLCVRKGNAISEKTHSTHSTHHKFNYSNFRIINESQLFSPLTPSSISSEKLFFSELTMKLMRLKTVSSVGQKTVSENGGSLNTMVKNGTSRTMSNPPGPTGKENFHQNQKIPIGPSINNINGTRNWSNPPGNMHHSNCSYTNGNLLPHLMKLSRECSPA